MSFGYRPQARYGWRMGELRGGGSRRRRPGTTRRQAGRRWRSERRHARRGRCRPVLPGPSSRHRQSPLAAKRRWRDLHQDVVMRFAVDDDDFRCSPHLAESAALVAADCPLVELEDREIKTAEAEPANAYCTTTFVTSVPNPRPSARSRRSQRRSKRSRPPETNAALSCRGTVLQRRRPTRQCPPHPVSRTKRELPLTTCGRKRVEPLRTSRRYPHVGRAAVGPRRQH